MRYKGKKRYSLSLKRWLTLRREKKRLNALLEMENMSAELANFCTLNGFKRLADIVRYPVGGLYKKPGFTMRIFFELIDIIQKNKLEDYLKDE